MLVTHGPPNGLGDIADGPFPTGDADPHQGSTTLRTFVERHPSLRFACWAHIHEAYGQGVLDRDGLPSPVPELKPETEVLTLPVEWSGHACVDTLL